MGITYDQNPASFPFTYTSTSTSPTSGTSRTESGWKSVRDMSRRGFVYPKYRAEKEGEDRWRSNRLRYDGVNDVLYIEPFEVRSRVVSRKNFKFCNLCGSCENFKSCNLCGSWEVKILTLIILFCSTGCFYSVWLLSKSYFSYEQSTNIVIQVKKTIQMTALSVCLYYPSVLSHSDSRYSELRKMDPLHIRDTEKKLTLEDIFQMTPGAEEVLTKCSFRLPNEFDLFKGDRKMCREHFTVSKYFTVQYICYRFTPKTTAGVDFSFLAVRHSLIHPGLFYQVSMHKSLFQNATTLQPSTYNWNGYPKSKFSTVIKNAPRTQRNKENETLSHFYLSYYMIHNQLLPPPFETNCINYAEESPYSEKSDCWDHCMRNLTIRTLNRLPFATVTKEDIPLKLVTTSDFENSTFESLYRSLEDTCARTMCDKNDCSQLMYVTTFVRREWTSDGLVFSVNTPLSPHLLTIFEPKWELFNFFIDVFNCFSNWFGISFMDFTKLSIILDRIM